ncbi:serine hydrolase domain-containing protein [Vibrio bivalvicida]|uniref:Serine hydrolase n=1 Tax=Vibrio bivalvicida TaxID=1276888 RepID=A0A177Y2W6_9VIBR|nr:serine hydrolase [Vibrio bivalvicida]OAJ95151.1 serine hydrolase [Vibrio bivalvicida]
MMVTFKRNRFLKVLSIATGAALLSSNSSAELLTAHHGMYEAENADAQNMFFYEQEGKQYLYSSWGVVPIEVNEKGEFKAVDPNIPLTGSFYHKDDQQYQSGRFQYSQFTSSFGRADKSSIEPDVALLFDDYWWNSLADVNNCDYKEWQADTHTRYNREVIESLIATSKDPNSKYANTDSLLIAKDGKLVIEEYFGGWRAEFPHTIQSISKSLTSLATGTAIKQKFIGGYQAKIADLIPSYSKLLQNEKSQLTLHHFLSMGAGLNWDEWSIPYENPNNVRAIEMASLDPVEFILDRDVAVQPGTQFQYNGGLVTVVGDIIAKKSSTKNLADYWQSSPINALCFQNAYMSMQAGGVSNAAGGAYMRPRDMLKVGQFVAQDGVWQQERILPEGWIERSTEKYLDTNDTDVSYGYYWWLSDAEVNGKTYSVTYGLGYGGQIVAVVNELNLVVARTAWQMAGPTPYQEMMQDYIIPAFTSVK